jgi:hypothetical protein
MRHSILVLAPLAFGSCYVHSPLPDSAQPEQRRATTYAADKQKLVLEMRRRMNELTRTYQAEIVGIQDRLTAVLAELEPPVRLAAVERTLSGFGAADAERYHAEVDRLVDEAVVATEALVGRDARPGIPAMQGAIERDALRIAAEVGGRASGAGYGFVSGIAEVDENAAVTVELLQGFASVQDLRAAGALKKGELIQCSEVFRHDFMPDEVGAVAPELAAMLEPISQGESTRVGRYYLYQSDVLENYRTFAQETTGVVLAFHNERLPASTKFELLQLVRYRVTRGGMIVEDFGWQLDPTTPGGDGRLDLRADLVDSRFIASEPFFPGVNIDHSAFDRLRDFSLAFDYKTLLVDSASGRAVGAIDWQLQWNVSMTRQVRGVDSIAPAFDLESNQLLADVRNGTARVERADVALTQREPAPSDLLGKRVVPITPANPLIERELGDGQVGPIAEPVGSDHLRITDRGRKWVLAHRLRLVANDARFMTYLDGQLGRYVLAIIEIEDGSALADLGFRDGDAIVHINGVAIEDFGDLISFFAEHPFVERYEVGLLRQTANRRLVFDVDLAGANASDPLPEETLTDEMIERVNALLADSAASESGE